MGRAAMGLLVVAGCAPDVSLGTVRGDDPVVPPQIEVLPASVQFGERSRSAPAEVSVVVRNVGGSVLDVEALRLEAPADFAFVAEPGLPLELAAGESASVVLRFQPASGGVREGRILVVSDDRDAPEVVVPISGFASLPVLQADPASLDLGQRPVGCQGRRSVRVQSVGREPARVDEVVVEGEGIQLSGLPQLPSTWESGSSFSVGLAFTSTTLGPWSGALRVRADVEGGALVVPISGNWLPRMRYEDRFQTPDTWPLDLLFAVDQSCSMYDQQQILAAEFERFADRLEDLDVDWRAAIFTGSAPACFEDVIDAGEPDWRERFARAVGARTSIALTNDLGDLTEAPLEGLSRASQEAGPGGCNEGFRRPEAALQVIAISDEREQSSGWFRSPTTYWLGWLADVEAWAGSPDRLVWHAIADLQSRCGEAPVGPGGHRDVAQHTGGILVDVCTTWADDFVAIADNAAVASRRFPLSWPDVAPASLEVRVAGNPYLDPLEWDPATSEVVLLGDVPRGEVVVTYERVGDCPP